MYRLPSQNWRNNRNAFSIKIPIWDQIPKNLSLAFQGPQIGTYYSYLRSSWTFSRLWTSFWKITFSEGFWGLRDVNCILVAALCKTYFTEWHLTMMADYTWLNLTQPILLCRNLLNQIPLFGANRLRDGWANWAETCWVDRGQKRDNWTGKTGS